MKQISPILRRHGIIIAAIVASLLGANRSVAQNFPSGPIKFVVPYPAGGAGDMVARLIGERLTVALSTPVVVLKSSRGERHYWGDGGGERTARWPDRFGRTRR